MWYECMNIGIYMFILVKLEHDKKKQYVQIIPKHRWIRKTANIIK